MVVISAGKGLTFQQSQQGRHATGGTHIRRRTNRTKDSSGGNSVRWMLKTEKDCQRLVQTLAQKGTQRLRIILAAGSMLPQRFFFYPDIFYLFFLCCPCHSCV